MKKPILCKLGFHRADKYRYETVTRKHQNGKKYRRNYVVCKRCGKRIAFLNNHYLHDLQKDARKEG